MDRAEGERRRFRCIKCGGALAVRGHLCLTNSAGNEEECLFLRCPADGACFAVITEEVFSTDEVFEAFYEMDEEKFNRDLALIEECPFPERKGCTCEVHRRGWRFG